MFETVLNENTVDELLLSLFFENLLCVGLTRSSHISHFVKQAETLLPGRVRSGPSTTVLELGSASITRNIFGLKPDPIIHCFEG